MFLQFILIKCKKNIIKTMFKCNKLSGGSSRKRIDWAKIVNKKKLQVLTTAEVRSSSKVIIILLCLTNILQIYICISLYQQ